MGCVSLQRASIRGTLARVHRASLEHPLSRSGKWVRKRTLSATARHGVLMVIVQGTFDTGDVVAEEAAVGNGCASASFPIRLTTTPNE